MGLSDPVLCWLRGHSESEVGAGTGQAPSASGLAFFPQRESQRKPGTGPTPSGGGQSLETLRWVEAGSSQGSWGEAASGGKLEDTEVFRGGGG